MSSQVEVPDQAIHLQQTIAQLQTLAQTIADLIERNEVLERENGNLQTELNEWHALVPQIKTMPEQAQANQEESIMVQKELNAIFTEREGTVKQLLSALEKEIRTHTSLRRSIKQIGEISDEHGCVTREEVRKIFEEVRIELLGGPSEGSE